MQSIHEMLAVRALREVAALPNDFHRKLQTVTDELGGMSDSAQLQFFLTPKPSLGRETPLEALLWGPLPRVVAAARTFAQGAAQ